MLNACRQSCHAARMDAVRAWVLMGELVIAVSDVDGLLSCLSQGGVPMFNPKPRIR